MHGNKKDVGLNGARALGSLSTLAISLKNVISGKDKARRSSSSLSEPDYLGDTWERSDMIRRRLTL